MSKTKNKHIAVIGTTATIQSQLYEQRMRELDPLIKTESVACPLFVPIVEEHILSGPIAEQIIEMYLSPLRGSGIDTLIMGCTHYPLLKNTLQNYFGEEVYLVDSGKSAALFVKDQLAKMSLLNEQHVDGFLHCYLSCRTPKFVEMAELCIGRDIHHLEHIEIEAVHISPADKPVST